MAASVALFIALTTGGAYAASQLTANSVGTKHLKNGAVTQAKLGNNAVTSGKVKPGSLLAKDFKAGQLPAGPRGNPGAQGVTGPQGAKGDPGAQGPAGPSFSSLTGGNSGGTSQNCAAQSPLASTTVTLSRPAHLLVGGWETFIGPNMNNRGSLAFRVLQGSTTVATLSGPQTADGPYANGVRVSAGLYPMSDDSGAVTFQPGTYTITMTRGLFTGYSCTSNVYNEGGALQVLVTGTTP